MNTVTERKKQIIVHYRSLVAKLNKQYEKAEQSINEIENTLKETQQQRKGLLERITAGPEPDEVKQEINSIELRELAFLIRFTKMQLEKMKFVKIQTDREREAIKEMIRNLKEGIF